jgi:imidazolonepropionase-like amidohydrolase
MWAGNQSLFATPEVIRQFRAGAALGAVVTSDMAKAGVGILAGCDSMVPGFCVHDELAAMVRGGMTPLSALQTATLNPAKYFHIENAFGSVESGRRADLVLLDANPLTDISNVAGIRAVVVSGRLLERKDLDGLLVRVKTMAGQP